jgi:hypothetical protein
VGFPSAGGDWTSEERSCRGDFDSGSYDEFTYYPDQSFEDSRYNDYNYGTNGYGRQSLSVPTAYNELLRASSSDSSEYPFSANYDMRNLGAIPPMQSPYGNQQMKCRQLPCRTFISAGSCPYGDRCVFLHDPAVVSKPIYIRSKVSSGRASMCSTLSKSHTMILSFQRKSKDDAGVDAFFWPTMPWNAVMGRVDMKNSKSTMYRRNWCTDLTNCTLCAPS